MKDPYAQKTPETLGEALILGAEASRRLEHLSPLERVALMQDVEIYVLDFLAQKFCCAFLGTFDVRSLWEAITKRELECEAPVIPLRPGSHPPQIPSDIA